MTEECDLLKLVAEVAKNKLRENASTKRHALKQFKDWIEKNPDIRDCRTDDVFLLSFLRKTKFSVPKAEQLFLRCVTFSELNPHFTKSRDFTDPKVNLYTRNGYLYMTPYRNENGCQIAIFRICRFDPYNCSYTDYLRAIVISFMTIVEDEATQVLGVVIIIDMANCTAAHMTHMPITELLTCVKSFQHILPIKFKAFHIVNVSPVSKWIIDLLVFHMSNKMKQRILCHSKMEDFFMHIDKKLLPKEYGGDMPEDEMIDLWTKNLWSKRDLVICSEKLRVTRVDHANLETKMAALPGSFRKLEVD